MERYEDCEVCDERYHGKETILVYLTKTCIHANTPQEEWITHCLCCVPPQVKAEWKLSSDEVSDETP